MKVWLVGEALDWSIPDQWLFQGIYSTEEAAVKKCITEKFFVVQVEIDYDEPPERREFDGAYYPLQQTLNT